MNRLLLIFIVLGLTNSTYSQNLKDDAAFFQRKSEAYQSWLDSRGIGQYLKVRELDIQEDELALYLEFPYQNTDSILKTWDNLKALSEEGNGLTLEEQLFYKMLFFMELRQGAANVQIYDTYDLRKEPLFFRGIYFSTEEEKVLVESSNPKSQTQEIQIPIAGIKQQTGHAGKAIEEIDKNKLFLYIENFAKAKYLVNTCENRNPMYESRINGEVLKIKVLDLCRVVLVDNTSGPICSILNSIGYACNTSVREMLDFTISVEQKEGTKEAILHMEINGKFGSGYYSEVGRGAYQEMELEPRFKEHIIDYAELFASDLAKYLRNLP